MAEIFKTPRYATRGISRKVPLDLQQTLCGLIDEKKQKFQKMDYLQIFELAVERMDGLLTQKVVHRQEQPPFEDVRYVCSLSAPMECRVWVIDDGEQATMLFPEEY